MKLPIAKPLRLVLRELDAFGIAPGSREGENWIRRRLEERTGKLCRCGAELRVWEVLARRQTALCTHTKQRLLQFQRRIVARAALAACRRKAC
jgi:hypothetical protein